MKANLLDKKGKVAETLELPSVFNEERIHKELMSQAVKAYLDNQRQSNAHTKSRGEVAGSTRKIYRQKGTGNSRQGSIRSPLHRKGGVVFGPRNIRNYESTLTKKMRKLAIRSALSLKAKGENVFVVDSFELPKTEITKYAVSFLKASKVKGKVLVVTDTSDTLVQKSFNNINKSAVAVVNELNVYTLLNYDNLVFTKKAMELAETYWKK
jgi:large subunit ribosomal protein L4